MYQDVSAKAAEHRKHTENDPKCVALGWQCIPLAVESYGAWGPEALRAFSQVAGYSAIRGNTPKSKKPTENQLCFVSSFGDFGSIDCGLGIDNSTCTRHGARTFVHFVEASETGVRAAWEKKIPDLYVDAISLSDLIAYLKADQDKLIDPQFCRHVREGVIKWRNETGVTTIVEMSETFQSLSLAMFSPDRESHKYVNVAHAVLLVIKTACQEFCPHLEVLELISYPSKASSDHSDDAKVQHSSLKAHPEGVELSLLKKALLEGVELSSLKNVLIEGDKHVSDVNVPSSQLMSELTNHVQKLEDDGSSASIFMCTLMDLMNDITSKIPAKWRSVDIQLGLPSGILDSIEEEVAGKPRACLDSFEQVSLPGNDNAPVHTPGIPSLRC
ncbi:hypothetical protein EMCRGX_G010968 [Ephydatia muelleri]